ncbi:MAG: alcohol dehydrogenase catalytic domain-containing protein [Candidatus Omnitrophica bacterium]|nr:alcohol dehydrogenase catalytic domain-containing protein [Candidatus Omnitrophota bacterium]
MKVAMYYKNDDVRLEEMPIPKIGSGELLMRVMASGICGSDVMQWYRIHKVPLVLGHEVAGEVVEVGEGVDQYKKGDRISASHHVPCGKCHYCLSGHETVCDTLRKTNFDPGGFAQYLRIPAINVKNGVYPLPGDVTFEKATFIEPVACVLRAQRLAGMKEGRSVLIIGSGISGILHVQMARINNASRVIATDISDFRLKAAKRFGADNTIYSKEDLPSCVRRFNDGRLADLVILCTGAKPALVQALDSVERGGTVLIFAATNQGIKIEKEVNDIFWRNEVTLMSSYAGSPQDHLEALELIRNKKINVQDMITHRFGLADTQKGFKLVVEAGNSIKVIIEPNNKGR